MTATDDVKNGSPAYDLYPSQRCGTHHRDYEIHAGNCSGDLLDIFSDGKALQQVVFHCISWFLSLKKLIGIIFSIKVIKCRVKILDAK